MIPVAGRRMNSPASLLPMCGWIESFSRHSSQLKNRCQDRLFDSLRRLGLDSSSCRLLPDSTTCPFRGNLVVSFFSFHLRLYILIPGSVFRDAGHVISNETRKRDREKVIETFKNSHKLVHLFGLVYLPFRPGGPPHHETLISAFLQCSIQ